MTTDQWHDLSCDELRSRLREQGVSDMLVESLVRHRDNAENARVITHYLSGEHRRRRRHQEQT